jgi:serine/threonine protein kinase
MSYPSFEQYNEAFQHPQLALTDAELKGGSVSTTGLGLPLALCGGFALTYTIKAGPKKFAVRCFHKKSNSLEQRYSAISRKIGTLRSPYFLDFQFQPQGVKVAGKAYPIVKMAWATGATLGEFMDRSYRNSRELQQLATSLRSLSKYLTSQNVAHGDIQPGNVMVANAGGAIQLIDYDGMYVEDLRSLGSAELGHRNFQHPRRSANTWDPTIDRFSFIAIDLALRALQAHPDLWARTHSDGDSILFKANDFADPTSSSVFAELFTRPTIAEDAKNFAAICRAPYEKIPSLEDFLSKKNIPQSQIIVGTPKPSGPARYLSAFPVLNATDYAACLAAVGEKVELIGQIVEVKEDKTRRGKPYVFINFGPWKGNIAKVSIWSEGLEVLGQKPDASWVGKWISVTGLMEPPYVSKKYKYSHLSISVTQGNQFHQISNQEAKFRLAGFSTRSVPSTASPDNKKILDNIKGVTAPSSVQASRPTRIATPVSSNAAILQNMKGSQQAPVKQTTASTGYTPAHATSSKSSSSWCFIASQVYGPDAWETNVLRQWRDDKLLPTAVGRAFVTFYYQVSPPIARLLGRSQLLERLSRIVLDRIVSAVRK